MTKGITDNLAYSTFIGGYITSYNIQDTYYNLNNQSKKGELINKSFKSLSPVEKANLLDVKFKDYVLEFTKVVSKIPYINLKYLSDNLNDLKINERYKIDNIFKSSKTLAVYNNTTNEINLVDFLFRTKTLYHELFHLSSSYYNDETGIYYSGFSQTQLPDRYNFGRGINEGYTQLLTERYFPNDKIAKSYYEEVEVTKRLEILLSEEKMTKLYFNADLYGLEKEIEEEFDITEEEFLKFLKNIDSLSNNFNHKNPKEKEKYINLVHEIYNLLAYCDFSKLYKKYQNGKINRLEFLVYGSIFSDKLEEGKINIYNEVYKLYDIDTLKERIYEDFNYKVGETNTSIKL
jgi:hypothetical protein